MRKNCVLYVFEIIVTNRMRVSLFSYEYEYNSMAISTKRQTIVRSLSYGIIQSTLFGDNEPKHPRYPRSFKKLVFPQVHCLEMASTLTKVKALFEEQYYSRSRSNVHLIISSIFLFETFLNP